MSFPPPTPPQPPWRVAGACTSHPAGTAPALPGSLLLRTGLASPSNVAFIPLSSRDRTVCRVGLKAGPRRRLTHLLF